MRNRRHLLAALLAAIALLGAACAGDDPTVEDVAAEGADNAQDAAAKAREAADDAAAKAEEAAEAADELADDVGDGPDASRLDLDIVEAKVEGDTAVLTMKVGGITIVAADGDTSGKSGHFHVFIDREPLKEGETIPKEDGIVHSADNPIRVPGLTKGEHELTVVLGDGNHQRIHDEVEAETMVTIA